LLNYIYFLEFMVTNYFDSYEKQAYGFIKKPVVSDLQTDM